MLLRVGDMVIVHKKDKAYIFFSGKYSYVTVLYLIFLCYRRESAGIVNEEGPV